VPPPAKVLADTPTWVFHRANVERKRADTIRRACAYAARLEETVAMAPADARRRLTALPGIGAWTAAEVAMVALGDADAVSLGDYHLPHQVSWALAGEPRGDDARMLELLEPWRGHRGRVLRLIGAGAGAAPRYGPRMPLRTNAGQ
jgi:3-methyladenine DNA glycosylase/8-oxoguanine DNA glycosylase